MQTNIETLSFICILNLKLKTKNGCHLVLVGLVVNTVLYNLNLLNYKSYLNLLMTLSNCSSCQAVILSSSTLVCSCKLACTIYLK